MQVAKEKLQKILGQIIQKQRRNISISQISNEIGLSKSIWSELEKGNKDIQLSTFWRIAEALNVKPSLLIQKIEDELGENFSFLEE